jgi:hypothetical protein
MKKQLISCSVLMFSLVITGSALAGVTNPGVIIISCGTTSRVPNPCVDPLNMCLPVPDAGINVTSFSSSVTPPPTSLATGASCAQAIAVLLDNGFKLKNIQPVGAGESANKDVSISGSITYYLVRERSNGKTER